MTIWQPEALPVRMGEWSEIRAYRALLCLIEKVARLRRERSPVPRPHVIGRRVKPSTTLQ